MRQAVLAALACFTVACGHSILPNGGFDDPAALPVPSGVVARQEPGAVVLSWDVEGDVYDFVDGWNVYRKTSLTEMPVRINDVLVMDVFYRDTAVAEGGEYYYSLRGESPARIESLPTDDIMIRYDSVAPPPPTGLTATPEPNAVLLRWDPSPAMDAAEYRVYRDGVRIALALVEPEYRDMPVSPARSWRYRVSVADGNGNESLLSEEVEITPLVAEDKTPPETPSGLGALVGERGVDLSWSGVSEADLAGYFVYRRGTGEPGFARAPGSGLLTGTSYRDEQVMHAQAYTYAVSAADTSGNESAWSMEVAITWVARVVNTGGSTLGSVYPWCGIAANSGRMHFLIPAADLARSGRVDTLGLSIQSGAAEYQNVTVSLGHTTASSLDASFDVNRGVADPLTVVYGPATVNSAVERQGFILPFPLTVPFDVDGVRNLLIEISWSGDDGRTVVFGFIPRAGRSLRLWQQPAGTGNHRLEENQQFVRVMFGR